jgi:hypothetical protein
MTLLRRWSPRIAAGSLALCACLTDQPAEELTGRWLSAQIDTEPAGWYQMELGFNRYGVFHQEVRSYGSYPGQGANELSAYSRIEGTYAVKDNSLTFTSKRLVWWDRFYGPDSAEQIEDPYSITLFDQATYRLSEDALRLEYLSYPFDAPVPTSFAFTRAPD